MNFDAVTIMALLDELRDTLQGGRVQDSVQIDAATFGLEIYAQRRRHYLLLSADQRWPRVHLSTQKLRRGVPKPSPLGLLLRRYVEGARIERITQPPWERVLTFELDGPEGVLSLVCEPMERRANVLLVRDDGVIVDCARRVGATENRVRQSLPGHPYVPPPPQKFKRDPFTLTRTLLADMLDNAPTERTRQILTRRLLGFSPQLAKEITYRATGRTNTKAEDTRAGALFEVIEEFLARVKAHAWQPGVVPETDGRVVAFSVYPLTYADAWEPVARVSEALERYYGAFVGEDAYEAAKKPVRDVLKEAQTRVRKRLEALRESLADEAELERLRKSGELLLAYQYDIRPGQTLFSAQYDFDAPPLEIPLDPQLSPLENAKHYFARYEKAKRARAQVPELIATAEGELAYLEQLETDLDLAQSWPEIAEVQEALQQNGYWRGAHTVGPRGGKSAPLRVVTDDGYVIWVGRNARQNDQVTFKKGQARDWWLHARGIPGAHVIVKTEGRNVPERVLLQAAALAAYYSRARGEKRVPVDITRRKYVRKLKGGKPGMVTYRNERTVEVEAVLPTEEAGKR